MCQTTAAASPSPTVCSSCHEASKYKCPKCEARSCSLECVKKHKASTGCDGKRDKTKYKSLGAMNDMDVVNDFRLMEEVTKGLDKFKRDKIKRSTRQGTELLRAPRLQKHLQRLQNQARSRGVRLRLLPPHFVRRKENTSMFDYKERIIKWKVQLEYIHCLGGIQSIVLPAVSENTKLWRMLVDQVEGEVVGDNDHFEIYKSVSYGGLSMYLKCEGLAGPGEQPRQFYPLDMKRSLKTNLKNTRLVEHPIIHVVLKSEDVNYREDQDFEDLTPETPPVDGETVEDNINIGSILTETDAMAADPEAYKQYFDFYLKYYSAKYSRQGSTPGSPAPGPGPVTHPAQLLLNHNNTFPGRSNSNLPAALTSFPPSYVPDFNRPPPCFSPSVTSPHIYPSKTVPSPGYSPSTPSSSKYPSRSGPPSLYPSRSGPPPPPPPSSPSFPFSIPPPPLPNLSQPTPPPSVPHPTPTSTLNANNSISAKNIQAELRKTAGAGLGLLASYGSDSDSDSN